MHLSAGDLLRAERCVQGLLLYSRFLFISVCNSATGSDVANLINEYITAGKIVPVEITVGLLDKVCVSSLME